MAADVPGADHAGEDALATQLIDALEADFPQHPAGTRPVHSTGIGAIGWFRSTPSAALYCKAEHFNHQWVPVRVRFSNGNGQPDPDGRLQVRGMAIRFYIGGTILENETGSLHAATEGPVGREEYPGDAPIVRRDPDVSVVTTDLVCMSVPMFMASNPRDTLAFAKAAVPRPVHRPSLLARLRSMATMRSLPAQEHGVTQSGDAGVLDFANRCPFAQGFVLESSMQRLPASYLRSVYHAVHAFELDGGDGVKRMARFSLEPSDGVRAAGPPEPMHTPIAQALLQPRVNTFGATLPERYLDAALADRLSRSAARFNVRIQLADQWDDTTDPTKLWDPNRRRVLMGTLRLNRLVSDQDVECESMGFNPGRLVDGIAPSDDAVLAARLGIYEQSYRRRMAARGEPVAASECPVAHR